MKRLGSTMWIFQDFSVIQILREINFGRSKSFKTDISAIFLALNFVNLVNFSLQKVHKFIKIKGRSFKYVKMADFELLQSAKLI